MRQRSWAFQRCSSVWPSWPVIAPRDARYASTRSSPCAPSKRPAERPRNSSIGARVGTPGARVGGCAETSARLNSPRMQMSIQWSIRSALAMGLLGAVVVPAHAQQRVLLDWSGRVDSVARISIQGGGARVSLVGTQDNGAGDLHVRNELPHRDGTVTVQVASGRGDVDVVQQPHADNDYTAIVRIRDHSGGMDRYQLTALWTPGAATTNEVAGEVDHPRRRDENVRDVGVLHWSGDVDKSVVVRWRGERAMLQTVDGDVARNVRADVAGAGLPDRGVTLRIVPREGRGP